MPMRSITIISRRFVLSAFPERTDKKFCEGLTAHDGGARTGMLIAAIVFAATLVIAFGETSSSSSGIQGAHPDAIYFGGTIITMDDAGSTAEAVAIRGDRIVAVGHSETIRATAGSATRMINLNGKVMTPGFYAAHDHFPAIGMQAVSEVDLNSPPMGKVTGISGIISALTAKAKQTPQGQWVVGQGYDDTLIEEMRHPTRKDLDHVSTVHPIVVIHISGHFCVANSRAMELAGVDKNTPDPQGGVIRRVAVTGEPDGVMEESARARVLGLVPSLPRDKVIEGFRHAAATYLTAGVTTMAIMGCDSAGVGDLRLARETGILMPRADVYLVRPSVGPPLAAEVEKMFAGPGDHQIVCAGEKMMHDGSIQGYTGYLTKPYFIPFKGDMTYRGYPRRSREELTARVVEAHRQGWHIAVHGNGDAAIDDILEAFAEAQKKFPRPDARHRIEHCQTVREDQLDRMKALGVTPSFFVDHVFYWGDRHRDRFLGPERASRISPLASALKRGIRFTVHNDTPVTPVSPLHLIWTSVNRLTTSGKVLGADQCITAAQALRALTIDAAWQNCDDNIKGSIEPGKLADFVILAENPLTIDPLKIKDIVVLETIVGGRTYYSRK